MPEPFITVGLTAWREGELLTEALRSLEGQTLQNWRCHLVLDGGADEKTRSIANAVTDPRIKVFQLTENAGPYPTRSVAIRETQTPYFFFLDADDTLPRDALFHADAACRGAQPDFVSGAVKLIAPDGKVEHLPPFMPNAREIVFEGRSPGVPVFRKSVWEELGGYASELQRGRADLDFMFGLIEGGYRGHLVEAVLYEYRMRETSVSRSYADTLAEKHEVIVRRHPKVFADPELRTEFLATAYLISAWASFYAGKPAAAAAWARKFEALRGARPVWPLPFAARLPRTLTRLLVVLRHWAGALSRVVKGRVSSPAA